MRAPAIQRPSRQIQEADAQEGSDTIAQPVKAVPDYHAFDLLLKYRYSDNLSFKLNVTNLTDEYYFEQLHPFHVVPGPGRSAIFAVNLDY